MKQQKNPFDVDTVSLGNYIAQLFIKTGGKYRCGALKINNLLSIYKISVMCFNYTCYNIKMRLIPNSPVAIFDVDGIFLHFLNDSSFFYQTLSYNSDNLLEQNNKPIEDEFLSDIEIPERFIRGTDNISVAAKALLEKIFRKFGNYTNKDINDMLKEILNDFIANTRKTYINDEELLNYLRDNFRLFNENEIVNFIKNIGLTKNEYLKDINSSKYLEDDSLLETKENLLSCFDKLSIDKQKQVLDYINFLVLQNQTDKGNTKIKK